MPKQHYSNNQRFSTAPPREVLYVPQRDNTKLNLIACMWYVKRNNIVGCIRVAQGVVLKKELGKPGFFLRRFRDPIRVPRIRENYHRAPKIRKKRVPRIREIGNVDILFIIFKLLTISVPSEIIMHWANICFSEHAHFRLSKWSFQWITNFVNYIINIRTYQNTNKITFH